MNSIRKLPMVVLSTFCLVLLLGENAAAHAILLEASPGPNAVVTGRAIEIRLQFNVRIDADRSRLTLVGPHGTCPLTMKSDDAPDILAGSSSNLTPGSYHLRWQVLATDGHITQGDVPFTVK